MRRLRGDDDKITRSQDQGQMEKPGPRRAACNIQTSSTEQMQAGKEEEEEEEEKSQERLHTSSTGEMQKEEGKMRASHEGSFCNILNWMKSEYLLAWESVKKTNIFEYRGSNF